MQTEWWNKKRTRGKRRNSPQTERCWRKRCDSLDPRLCPCMPVSLSGLEASWKRRLFHGRSWEDAEACGAAAEAAAVGSTCRTSASSDPVASGLSQHSSAPLHHADCFHSLTSECMHTHARSHTLTHPHTHTHSHVEARCSWTLDTSVAEPTQAEFPHHAVAVPLSGFLFFSCLRVSGCAWRWVRNTQRERGSEKKRERGRD